MSTPEEIKLPEHIASAVIDAIGWMISEGQWFDDEVAGKELMAYLVQHYPDSVPDRFRQ